MPMPSHILSSRESVLFLSACVSDTLGTVGNTRDTTRLSWEHDGMMPRSLPVVFCQVVMKATEGHSLMSIDLAKGGVGRCQFICKSPLRAVDDRSVKLRLHQSFTFTAAFTRRQPTSLHSPVYNL
eukprot:scaffold3029_cov278-Alexandrium_tamarense.AAC.2